MKNMQENKTQQTANEAHSGTDSAAPKSNESKPPVSKGDYIDFEEIK